MDQALRDCFACGLRSEAIQKSLLSEAELDFTREVNVVQGMEAVHKNTQTMKVRSRQWEWWGRLQNPLNLPPVGKMWFRVERSQIATVAVGQVIYRMNVASGRPYVTIVGGEDT